MKLPARAFWRTFHREWRRISASRFLFWASGPAPVLLFLLTSAVFQQEVMRELPVAVVDQDQSALSRQMVRLLDATASLHVAEVFADPADAEYLVRKGSIYGFLVIPRGLESDVLRGERAKVLGFYNAAFLSAGSVANREFRTVMATLSYGIKQQRFARHGVTAAPLEPVRVQSTALFNPQLNYAYFLLVAVLPALLQLFIALVAVEAVGTELRWGTAAEWIAQAENRPVIAVLGKVLPYTLLSLVTAVVMITILFRLVDVPLRGSLLPIAMASLLLVLSYEGIGFLLVALTANLRMATSLAAFYTGPALAYMGISFPQMGMPAFGQFWGNLLPVTHYVRLLVGQGIRGDDWLTALPDLGRLALFVLVPWLLAMIRIGPVLRNSRYWGRT